MKNLQGLFQSQKVLVGIASVVLLLAALAPTYYLYRQYKKSQELFGNQPLPSEQEVSQLVTAVGKLIELPSGETPTVATVADKTRLTDQPFFANSQNGDKVLIYATARKAILYRPSTGKIIEIAPVNIQQASESAQVQTNPSSTPAVAGAQSNQTFRLAIYNSQGADQTGLQMEQTIKTSYPDAAVASRLQAVGSYESSFLVDISGSKKLLATEIADKLGVPLGGWPGGEATPAADFLLIVGTGQ